jgi:hypothetical protein
MSEANLYRIVLRSEFRVGGELKKARRPGRPTSARVVAPPAGAPAPRRCWRRDGAPGRTRGTGPVPRRLPHDRSKCRADIY